MRFVRRLLRAVVPRRYATGGVVPAPALDDDSLPAILSPGRSTTIRPGETLLEATERLTRGEDL